MRITIRIVLALLIGAGLAWANTYSKTYDVPIDFAFQCAKKTVNDAYLIRTVDAAKHVITFQRYKDVGKKADAGEKWKNLVTLSLSPENPGFTQAVVSGPHLGSLTGKIFLKRFSGTIRSSNRVNERAAPNFEACGENKTYGKVCAERPAGAIAVKAVSYWTIPYEHTYQQYVPGQPPSYDCSSDGNGGMFCDPEQIYSAGAVLTRVRYHVRQLTLVSAKDGSTYLLECSDQESNGNRMSWRQALANGLYGAGQGAANALQDYSAGVQESPGSSQPAETRWPCYHLTPGDTYLARVGEDFTTVYAAKSVRREGDRHEVVLSSFNFRTAGQWVKSDVPTNLLPPRPASAAQTPSEGATQTATATVRSSPDAAHILVDGNYVGDTPSTLNLTPGEHFIAIEKSGFETWHRKVLVASGNKITISATLPPTK